MAAPYSEHVGSQDPVVALRTSLAEYRALLPRIPAGRWSTPWAPGKWTLAQLMLHVTQWEMIFGLRVRCALSVPDYHIQPMDQDPFVDLESKAVDGPTAGAAFEAVRAMNLALAASLTPTERAITAQHPTRGLIDVNDLLFTLAGHPIHHFKQMRQAVGG